MLTLTSTYIIEGFTFLLISTIAWSFKKRISETDCLLKEILAFANKGQVQRAEILKDVVNIQDEIRLIRHEIDKHGTDITILKTSVARLEEWRKFEDKR